MPDDVFICDAATAQRRVATQFPQWADLEVTPVASTGTDNWMFRLGPDLALRHTRALRRSQIVGRVAGEGRAVLSSQRALESSRATK